MAERTIIACDVCGNEPADTLTLDLGDGLRRVDICPDDADKLAVPRFLELVAERGHAPEPGSARPAPKSESMACPVCGKVLAHRGLVIRHLMAPRLHGLSQPEASKMVGPSMRLAHNGPITCRLCGTVTTRGPGFSRHLSNNHPGTDYETEVANA